MREEAALAAHTNLAASLFDKIMKRALNAEGLHAEIWFTFRNGWPWFDYTDLSGPQPKIVCPKSEDDFPRKTLSATVNFCVLLLRDIKRREDYLHSARSFASSQERQDAYIELRSKQTRRWRDIISSLMPLTEGVYNIAGPSSRESAITLLVTTVLSHCPT